MSASRRSWPPFCDNPGRQDRLAGWKKMPGERLISPRGLVFRQDASVKGVAFRAHVSALDGRQHAAARLMAVGAVVETALGDRRRELREPLLDVMGAQVLQTESLEARRIDQAATFGQGVELGAGGGVAACAQRFGVCLGGRQG